MRFLTWANDPTDPRCELMFKSARHFGIEVEPIGVGKEYRGGVSKIEWLAEELKTWLPYSYDVICVDAFDCLFIRDPSEIDVDSDRVTYAGERWFRNRPPLMREYFSRVPNDFLYRFPNAGLVAGGSGVLRDLYYDLHVSSSGSMETREQWFVSLEFRNNYKLLIDDDCRLFYCCGGEWRRFAGEVVDGRFRNKRTGTYPYILHAPIPRRSLPIRERIARELGII